MVSAAGVHDADLDGRVPTRLGAQSFEAGAAIAGQGVAILTPQFYTDDVALVGFINPSICRGAMAHDYWLALSRMPDAMSRKIRNFRDWILSEFNQDCGA